ncbi:MAG: DUF4878 domain-containing protein [Ferruginibacter sp.]
MKRIILASAIAFTAFFITGCGNSGGDPKSVLITFFETLGKKDIEGARKLATADSKGMLDIIEMGIKSAPDNKSIEKFDKNKAEFGEAKIEGDRATVPVKEKESGQSANFVLKKENGSWKVAFDMATLAEMGTEKLKESGEFSADSLNKAMEEIKKLDGDSLKAALEEIRKLKDDPELKKKMLEAFDSAQKEQKKH